MHAQHQQLDEFEPHEGHWTVQAALACTIGIERAAERRARPIRSAAEYVGVCRRLARGPLGDSLPHPLEGAGRIDGRLVAAGWNLRKPTRWVEADLWRFLGYWQRAADRPETVGSCYNAEPAVVARCWAAGMPAHACRALGTRLTNRVGRVPRWRALPERRRRMLLIAARAALRASLVGRAQAFDLGALRLLGELCPEGQATVVAAVPEKTWQRGIREPVRARDLVECVAAARPVLDALARDTSGRMRLALALRPDGTGGLVVGRRARLLLPPDGACYDVTEWTARVLSPEYPWVPLDVARRLALGESPAQIAGGSLTDDEAAAWCVGGAEIAPLAWLCRWLGVSQTQTVTTARWLAALGKTPEGDIALVRRALGDGEKPEVPGAGHFFDFSLED